ncbi:cold shock domain-containing protein CG9705 [Eurytemora carolleeae]|uniref:cold shock domain-containing protein CG9705 n=1 Tax=Eurytemora carolleeae TaxID=1294199 RepID=UPI000C795535|nr:cold shock domain-containing protein CG9705 [Eurytemora carolleeae]|eukprot:XP_023324579.1 cold shock domain-containing protein CG9705-like [Eurytemora affinis]
MSPVPPFSPPKSPIDQHREARRRCMSCSESDVFNTILEEHGALEKHTKHERSSSLMGRIKKFQCTGTIVYFCRSRGHGFIKPDKEMKEGGEEEGKEDKEPENIFVHISDIDNDFEPRAGDRVGYQILPMPPKFEKYQAVHVHVIGMTQQRHKAWTSMQTPEEIQQETIEMKKDVKDTTPAAADV